MLWICVWCLTSKLDVHMELGGMEIEDCHGAVNLVSSRLVTFSMVLALRMDSNQTKYLESNTIVCLSQHIFELCEVPVCCRVIGIWMCHILIMGLWASSFQCTSIHQRAIQSSEEFQKFEMNTNAIDITAELYSISSICTTLRTK